jgi:hypothetical protein
MRVKFEEVWEHVDVIDAENCIIENTTPLSHATWVRRHKNHLHQFYNWVEHLPDLMHRMPIPTIGSIETRVYDIYEDAEFEWDKDHDLEPIPEEPIVEYNNCIIFPSSLGHTIIYLALSPQVDTTDSRTMLLLANDCIGSPVSQIPGKLLNGYGQSYSVYAHYHVYNHQITQFRKFAKELGDHIISLGYKDYEDMCSYALDRLVNTCHASYIQEYDQK